jgi:hypothetical protein
LGVANDLLGKLKWVFIVIFVLLMTSELLSSIARARIILINFQRLDEINAFTYVVLYILITVRSKTSSLYLPMKRVSFCGLARDWFGSCTKISFPQLAIEKLL